jgi:2,3-bisphosphoglycerate-dependent phosphoglycerate mutase
VIIVAHLNSLKAIIKQIDKVSDFDIMELNIPTAFPLVYELDENLNPIKNYYIATERELKNKFTDNKVSK